MQTVTFPQSLVEVVKVYRPKEDSFNPCAKAFVPAYIKLLY